MRLNTQRGIESRIYSAIYIDLTWQNRITQLSLAVNLVTRFDSFWCVCVCTIARVRILNTPFMHFKFVCTSFTYTYLTRDWLQTFQLGFTRWIKDFEQFYGFKGCRDAGKIYLFQYAQWSANSLVRWIKSSSTKMEQWNRMLNPTLEFWCLVLEHLHIFAKYMNFSAGKICGVWKLETIFQKISCKKGKRLKAWSKRIL